MSTETKIRIETPVVGWDSLTVSEQACYRLGYEAGRESIVQSTATIIVGSWTALSLSILLLSIWAYLNYYW